MSDAVSAEQMSEADQVNVMLNQMGDGTAGGEPVAEDAPSTRAADFDFPEGDAGQELMRLVGALPEETAEAPAVPEPAEPQVAQEQTTTEAQPRDPETGRFVAKESELQQRIAQLERREAELSAKQDLRNYASQQPPQMQQYQQVQEQMMQQQQQMQQQMQQMQQMYRQRQEDPYGYEQEAIDPQIAQMQQQMQQMAQQQAQLQKYNQDMAAWNQRQEDMRAAQQLNQETVNALSHLGVTDKDELEMMRGYVLSKYHAVSGTLTPAYLAKEVVGGFRSYVDKRAQTKVQHHGENLRVAGRQPGASAATRPEDHPVIKNFGEPDDWETGLLALRKHYKQ